MTSSQRSDTVVHAGITHASSAETSPASAILTPSSDIPALFAPSDIFKYQLLGQETPTTTRIWAQTECWRISSSPPASVWSPSRSPRFWRMSTCTTASREGRDQ
ncbi:hypothetical protein PC117_g25609 [Phytophthora cactorum]|uniref:Uncharacterized protein n=1 Tax=Phytophthora cactorum TaxID=29920 RepID=A0A8T1AR83_9STRA|nr:hypothetical protein PC117_g25609 [Phytophthora cactorum]